MNSSEAWIRGEAPARRLSPAERLHGPQPAPAPTLLRSNAVPYTRFIPREELSDFAAWQPGAFAEPPTIAQPPQPGAPRAPVRARQPDDSAPPGPPVPPWPQSHAFAGAAAAAPTSLAEDLAAAEPPPDPEPAAALDPQLLQALQAEWEQQAAQQAQAARTQGYQDGYRDGLAALESFKQSFASQTTAQVAQLVQAIDEDFGRLEQDLAASVARVATALARQVVRSELALRPGLVADVARDAVQAVLGSARQISLLVHPDDHALVARGCSDALAARGVRLLAASGIARGGCRVESDAGAVDAQIATRWAQATEALGTGQGWDDGDAAGPGGDA